MGVACSVIIPVHNGEGTLGDQLSALADQADGPEFEVVVVLNRCSDNSRALAESFSRRFPLVLVEADRHASAAYARNVGVANASAPLLLFCDADDRVYPQWIAEMAKAFQPGGPDFVGGRLVVDRSGLPDWLYRAFYQSGDGLCIRTYLDGLPYVLSGSFGCRREAFEAVRGFDESFSGAGAEEIDLSARLLRAGYRIGEAPAATLLCRPRRTMREALTQVRGYASGGARFAAKEGRLETLSRRAMVTRTMRTLGYWIVRERLWDPRGLSFVALRQMYVLRADRRFLAEQSAAG